MRELWVQGESRTRVMLPSERKLWTELWLEKNSWTNAFLGGNINVGYRKEQTCFSISNTVKSLLEAHLLLTS